MTEYVPCDVCGSIDVHQIQCLAQYGLEGQIVVCARCGFVFVPERRTEQQIADAWSNEIFGDGYSSSIPYVSARLYWVALELSRQLRLDGLKLADVGSGEGLLLTFLKELAPGASLLGIDPGFKNITGLKDLGIDGYVGTAQSAAASGNFDSQMDVLSLTWTLENSNDCRLVLQACNRMLRPGGHLAIATGSRILVPFKKPLSDYLSSQRLADTHAFRWSYRSLSNLLEQFGFKLTWENSWRDSDWMLLIARKCTDEFRSFGELNLVGDDPAAVLEFFDSWHANTVRLAEWGVIP